MKSEIEPRMQEARECVFVLKFVWIDRNNNVFKNTDCM